MILRETHKLWGKPIASRNVGYGPGVLDGLTGMRGPMISPLSYVLGVRSVVKFGRINQWKSKKIFRTINENKIGNMRTQKLDTLK